MVHPCIILTVILAAFIDVKLVPKPKKTVAQPEVTRHASSYKVILAWTTFFGHDHYYFGLGHQPFISNKCEVTDCIFTNDRNTYDESELIIFHGRDMDGLKDVPKYRYPHQLWAWYNMEPPHQSAGVFDNIFNIAMCYQTDSEIYQPYGSLRPLQHNEGKPDPTFDFSAGKTEMVAWFASNCNTLSKREKYVEELQKHISVHVYGRCGTYTCPREKEQACMKLLKTKYRFYLAFENSICKDYVTEKLWMMMAYETNVILVVLGGADYANFLPPGSYIDVKDFDHPKSLANFLTELSEDSVRFNEFFNWKQTHKAVMYDPHMLCLACKFIHENQGKKYPVKRDMTSWWNTNNRCAPPSLYYQDTSYL